MLDTFSRSCRLVRRAAVDAGGWERIVFAEMLIPETPNSYGDYWTKEGIREAAYEFAKQGYGIDVNHDNNDVTGAVHVIESFIAREGDPDFIVGSWVVGMHIADDTMWDQVLAGEINGYSYEAIISFTDAILAVDDDGLRMGYTEPDVNDGHIHSFILTVDDEGFILEGGTDTVNGHSHSISGSVVTDAAEDGHVHRFNYVTGVDGK